jgi:hypothetical protein
MIGVVFGFRLGLLGFLLLSLMIVLRTGLFV